MTKKITTTTVLEDIYDAYLNPGKYEREFNPEVFTETEIDYYGDRIKLTAGGKWFIISIKEV